MTNILIMQNNLYFNRCRTTHFSFKFFRYLLSSSVEHKKITGKTKPNIFHNEKKKRCSLSFPVNLKDGKSKTPNPAYFHEIILADKLSRKKRKTNMQIKTKPVEKITCSYTGKGLVSSPTELCIPMIALTFVTGQSCAVIWAGKSVSSWKLRKNGVIGCKVTLRRQSAVVFLNKFYVYGREGLIDKNNNFLNKSFPFHFGVSKNYFIELQKSDRFSANFSGFSVSLN